MALTEGRHAAEFLASEAEDTRSRDAVTVLSGQTLTAGTVVGKSRYGIGGFVQTAVSGTGNGTMTAVSVGPDVQVGTYTIKCTATATNGGTFSVLCPDGTYLANATVGTAFVSTHVNFLLNDGSTDFAANDQFTVVVSTTAPVVVGGTGTGTMSALAIGRNAKPGNYRVVLEAAVSHGGDFDVLAPDGTSIGRFLMGTTTGAAATFTSDHITFTLTDATDFILGNYFNVVVYNVLAPKVAAWSPRPTTYDGRQTAAGIVLDNYDASGGDVDGVIIARDAEVVAARLQWLTGLGAADKTAGISQLAALGIVAR